MGRVYIVSIKTPNLFIKYRNKYLRTPIKIKVNEDEIEDIKRSLRFSSATNYLIEEIGDISLKKEIEVNNINKEVIVEEMPEDIESSILEDLMRKWKYEENRNISKRLW